MLSCVIVTVIASSASSPVTMTRPSTSAADAARSRRGSSASIVGVASGWDILCNEGTFPWRNLRSLVHVPTIQWSGALVPAYVPRNGQHGLRDETLERIVLDELLVELRVVLQQRVDR